MQVPAQPGHLTDLARLSQKEKFLVQSLVSLPLTPQVELGVNRHSWDAVQPRDAFQSLRHFVCVVSDLRVEEQERGDIFPGLSAGYQTCDRKENTSHLTTVQDQVTGSDIREQGRRSGLHVKLYPL